MRLVVQAALLAVWLAAGAYGQEVRKPADWEKMYQDASAQLQSAQNRKAELAAENSRLGAKVAQLQHDLQAVQTQADSLGRQVETFAQQTSMLRAFYNDWHAYTEANPRILGPWRSFYGALPAWFDRRPLIFDPNWPLTGRE